MLKEEGSSATDSVTDVTDLTDLTDLTPGRKKAEGRRQKSMWKRYKINGFSN